MAGLDAGTAELEAGTAELDAAIAELNAGSAGLETAADDEIRSPVDSGTAEEAGAFADDTATDG